MTAAETIEERIDAALSDDPDLWLVSDETDTVHVSVDAAGELATLRIAPSWWRRVAPEELGPLVLRLNRASAVSRLQTISDLGNEGLQHAPQDPRSVTDMPSPSADSLDMSSMGIQLEDLLSAFSEFARYRDAVQSAVRESTTLRSPSGNVMLEILGGSPQSLVVDKMNVQFVSEREIAAEILELLGRARNWLGERRAAVMNDLPSLAGVARSVRGV